MPTSPARDQRSGIRVFLSLGFSAIVSACAVVPSHLPTTESLYRAAIIDAAVTRPDKVAPLQSLPESVYVNMVSWVTEQRAPCKNGESPCRLQVGHEPLWVTIAGEVQQRCQGWNLRGDALRERLEQLLGLPPDTPTQYRKVRFVILEVPRDRIERPCLGTDEKDGKPVCTIVAKSSTPLELRQFVGQQMSDSYVLNNPKGPGYPFTRLGYTYDWAPDARSDHYGASEFLIKPDTTTRVLSQSSADDYCQAKP
jgi:hypothetical protein